MRRAIASGTPRNTAITLAVKAHVTYQAIADELGISRQRVQQIAPGVTAKNAMRVCRPSASPPIAGIASTSTAGILLRSPRAAAGGHNRLNATQQTALYSIPSARPVSNHGGAIAYLARFQSTRATPAPADRLELVYLSSSPVIAKIRF